VQLRVVSRELGFPLDGVLAVTDVSGKSLEETDDPGRRETDPALVFTAPADGEYQAVLRDLHGRGGLRFVYRLTIGPVQPDFGLTLASDSFTVSPGKSVEIPVTVDRRDGFDQPITIQAVGLPTGVTCEAVISEPKGNSAKSVKLVLKAAPDAAAQSAPIRIEGAAPLERSAHFSLKTPFSGDHWAVWLTIAKK
jgi:hypothetical protein